MDAECSRWCDVLKRTFPCPCFSPHEQECCQSQLQSSWEPGKGARSDLGGWRLQNSVLEMVQVQRTPSPRDHKHPRHLFQCGIFISGVLGCGCWHWLYFHCGDGCMGIAQLRITVVLHAPQSRQRRGTAALEDSFLSWLPAEVECVEGRMVLQLGHWTGRTGVVVSTHAFMILKVTWTLLHFVAWAGEIRCFRGEEVMKVCGLAGERGHESLTTNKCKRGKAGRLWHLGILFDGGKSITMAGLVWVWWGFLFFLKCLLQTLEVQLFCS